MDYSVVNLKYKILELYPEIINYGIDIFLIHDPERDRYEVKLSLPAPESTVFVGKAEADACMQGKASEFLGQSIERFIASLSPAGRGDKG